MVAVLWLVSIGSNPIELSFEYQEYWMGISNESSSDWLIDRKMIMRVVFIYLFIFRYFFNIFHSLPSWDVSISRKLMFFLRECNRHGMCLIVRAFVGNERKSFIIKGLCRMALSDSWGERI